MGKSISLTSKKREIFGKKVKLLREQGIMPGVVYGHGNPTDHIEINMKEFGKVFKEAGSNTIVDLEIDGKKVKTIIYDVTFDPISEAPRHADFYRIKMDQKLTTHVPLTFVGESPAVRTLSAIIVHPKDELEIFEETDKTVNIKDFTNIYKQLIAEKAHASVLNFYIKENSAQKHLVDKRVELYGEEGAKLVEEMGLDYEMRFSPKSEYVALDKENMDYVPFLEITAKLKGSATINARS